MSIFHSLGSNYSLPYCMRSLFGAGADQSKLTDYLDTRYGGTSELFYKGREALHRAFKLLSAQPGDLVAMNGFTCYAVYEAIVNAGFRPLYIDVAPNTLHFSVDELIAACSVKKNVCAVVVQNTLGYPCAVAEIADWCRKHNIPFIEDLAHSIGSTYSDGEEVGTKGDVVALSFSQDKAIDAVSGGALIIRNKLLDRADKNVLNEVSAAQQFRDRLYPLLTYIIRKTYDIGVGAMLHTLFKSLRLLSNPMSYTHDSATQGLSKDRVAMARKQFSELKHNLQHRLEIARYYASQLDQSMLIGGVISTLDHATNLRFPILVPDREKLIQVLKRKGFHLSDIWYDAPIAPKKYLKKTDYQHQCPRAEKISSSILNLPTHRNISQQQAVRLVKEINSWVRSR